MKSAWAFALVLVGTLPPMAFASDLDLIMGRRAPSAFEGEVKQFISVKNNGTRTMSAIVECGFIKAHGDVVDTGDAPIANLKPGQTAYAYITSSGAFDHADCRIGLSGPVAPQ
jgi:hypothetical protein